MLVEVCASQWDYHFPIMSECVNCKKHFASGSSIVPCIICRGLFRADTTCANLSASETRVLELKKTPMMVYRCQGCTTQSDLYPDVRQMVSELKDDIQKLNSGYTAIEEWKSQYEDETWSVWVEEGSSINWKYESTDHYYWKWINHVKIICSISWCVYERIISLQPVQVIDHRSPDALAAEIQDRLRRSQNIILYKVPEPQLAVVLWDHQRRSATEASTHSNDLEDLPSRSATEAPTLSNNLEYIRNLLAKINNIDLTQLKVRRLHSENNKGGHIPVLVRLQSSLR